jgi:hypothetical protein
MAFEQFKLKIEYVKIKGVQLRGETLSHFDIYESICDPGILGDFSFSDWQGLKEFGEVFAGDDLEMCFNTENKERLVLKFKIYASEENFVTHDQPVQRNKFSFCSPWLIDALTRQISKPFVKKFTHEIIRELLTDCGAEVGFIEPTKEKLEIFVSPLWKPIHTIRHLLSHMKSESGKGGYLFWTDLKTGKVNVATLDYLMKGSLGTYDSFMVHPGNIRYDGRAYEIHVENNFDMIRHVNLGMFQINNLGFWFDKNRHQGVNDSSKEYKHTHLGKFLPVNKTFTDKKYQTTKFSYLYPHQAAAVTDEKLYLEDLEADQRFTYSMLFSDVFKLNILASGETTRRAGWLAKLDFPSQNEALNKSGNKHFKGKYLIRDIRHSFGKGDVAQFISLVSDGFADFDRDLMVRWQNAG